MIQVVREISVDGKKILLVRGDITERSVDAIVNPANSYLRHGGGLAAAIIKKGGKIIQEESDKIGQVPVGNAVITGSGNLSCKAVIHAVGPKYGEGNEDQKLRSALKNALKLAEINGFKSIAIPAISSGIFGFPKDRCAKTLVDELMRVIKSSSIPKSGASSLQIFEFCIIDEETLQHFKVEFDRIK
ncbi:MAG TPA: macro domain-containing protein [Nitrososphaeraceae archaeon]|nr:macro domain-containing protein [Nitrososphaeraceae archaeon]